MKDFRQHFFLESVEKLENLFAETEQKETLSDPDKNAIFRTLHTIKGTSQTFDLKTSSRLAHELENLLSAKIDEKIFKQILLEGILLLKKSFEKSDFQLPEEFVEKLGKFAPSEETGENKSSILSIIPNEFLVGLSSQENAVLIGEIEKGRNIFCAEISFEISNFSAGLKTFREKLCEKGVILATFPSAKFTGQGKIGFQILFSSFEETGKIQKFAEDFSAEIIFNTSPETFKFDLQGVLAQIVSHGKTVAQHLCKTVEFGISAEEFEISEKNLKIIFDALLHLVRNAVDHAFEEKGKIKISVKKAENGLTLMVSDNGRGIDLEKIKAKAVEKNLLQEVEKNSDEATLGLIFQSEFSTAEKITEISGRGIGLDAVKDSVENANGKIKVKSETNKGTTFEIFLPENE